MAFRSAILLTPAEAYIIFLLNYHYNLPRRKHVGAQVNFNSFDNCDYNRLCPL